MSVERGDLGERGPHGRGEPDRPLVLADPGDGGGEPADGVGPVDLGAVAGLALGGQLQPARAALPGRDGVERHAGSCVEGEGAGLADALRAALEELGVLVGEEAGAVVRAGLLVGGVGDDDVAARAYARTGPGADDGEDHRVHVLHVDGAAPPHDAVADLAGEGVHGPVGRLGGHHVEVAVDEEGVGGRVGALDPGDDVGPARRALQEGRFQPGVREPLGDVLGGRSFPAVPPPRLVVSIRISSEVNVTDSSSARSSTGPVGLPASAILLLHGGRHDRRHRLEVPDAFVHRPAGIDDAPLAARRHAGDHGRGGPPDARRRTPAPP